PKAEERPTLESAEEGPTLEVEEGTTLEPAAAEEGITLEPITKLESIRTKLSKLTVDDALPWQKDGSPIVIEITKSFAEGIQILADYKILCAPIYDPVQKTY